MHGREVFLECQVHEAVLLIAYLDEQSCASLDEVQEFLRGIFRFQITFLSPLVLDDVFA